MQTRDRGSGKDDIPFPFSENAFFWYPVGLRMSGATVGHLYSFLSAQKEAVLGPFDTFNVGTVRYNCDFDSSKI